jgi:hypothetical protein
MVGEQLGQVSTMRAGQVFELGAAGEPVREQYDVVRRASDGREQGGLGDSYRDLVVASFDAEVARQSTTPAHGSHLCASASQQVAVGLPAEYGLLVAVRLDQAAHPGQVR